MSQMQLRDSRDLEETYFIIDLLASEYGWTIEIIQNLTMPEISGLVQAIVKRYQTRNGQKPEETSSPAPKNDMEKLMALASKLKANPEQLKAIRDGKEVRL